MATEAPRARGPYKDRNATGEVLSERITVRLAPSNLAAYKRYAKARGLTINAAINDVAGLLLKLEVAANPTPEPRRKAAARAPMTLVENAARRVVGDARTFHAPPVRPLWPLNVRDTAHRSFIYARAALAGFPKDGDRHALLEQVSRLVEATP